MRIVIGSKRRPKIEGTKRAVARALTILGRGDTNVTFETFPVESGVAGTPRSLEELLAGARNRAIAAYPRTSTDALSIGLEGGLFPFNGSVFLQSWACVYDGTGVSFGASGAIEIPRPLAERVMLEGEDLGTAIYILAGKKDVRSNEGTWGVLTKNAVTREDSFALAVLNALMPVLNHQAYGNDIA